MAFKIRPQLIWQKNGLMLIIQPYKLQSDRQIGVKGLKYVENICLLHTDHVVRHMHNAH